MAKLGPSGIRVNAICPGTVEGDRLERIMAAKARGQSTTVTAIRSQMVADSSLGKTVRPDDIAAMALFLVSNAGASISGHVFPVDADAV
ncbi:SDR family oxidoreductase [Bradyrhizobium icense]|uniref:SDR family oxidoreductase n=1 Tax=Bradyrhizobium icense TaxID=1274631 RepID=UPI0018D394A7|nr:SDR family oxidoreductase [Bradyrhizobium icense]